jgi:signal transduction histidine kinase
MTIRTRLTLLFTLIVSLSLLLFCGTIYFFAERYRQQEFEERLREEALTSAELLFGRETISPELYKLLDRNQMTVLTQEEIIIYDARNRIAYESGTDYLNVSREVLNRVRLEGEVYWREDEREIVGVRFADGGLRFVVFASALDKYGFRKQRNLAFVLAAGWLLGTGVVFGLGRFFAGRALRPINRVIGRIDAVTASRLDLRLEEGPEQDEIAQLSRRFNRMLDRLEEAFRSQRGFVSNASHELRTPLTAITGQLEVALLADEDPAELRATLGSVLDDVRQLNRLTNGLLSLAEVNLDESAVSFEPITFDELLWQVRSELQKTRPTCTVRVQLDVAPESEAGFSVSGNASLLRSAIFNLLDNGCKFSPEHAVDVRLSTDDAYVTLSVQNAGPSIAPDELPHLFRPFWRGQNSHGIAGHGIGLPLVDRIVRLHRGRLDVESDDARGTTFTLSLPAASVKSN